MPPPPPTEPPGLLLAMDTSSEVCGVALFRDGRLASELTFRHEMHLSERLIGHVDALLRAETAELRDVNCFAVGIGPGSFTGTRIGVMTVKTFAFLQERPIATVNSLEAMAAEYSGMPAIVVVPMLPCRGGVVYAAAYRVAGEEPEPLLAPDAYPTAELATAVGKLDGAALFCGPHARRHEAELRSALGPRGQYAGFGAVEFPGASAIGRLALVRLRSGAPPALPLEVAPLYISPPPVTMPKAASSRHD